MSNLGASSKKLAAALYAFFISVLLLVYVAPAFSEDKIAVKTDGVEIKFNALTQFWLTATFGHEKPSPYEWHTYKFRRSQLQFSGNIDEDKFKWLLMADFSTGQDNPLQDLYMDLSYVPKITLKAGQFKPPFLMENLTPDNQLDFVERSLIIRTFADVRDIGFILYTKLKHFEAYAGEVNGRGPNAPDWYGRKDLIGRLVIKPGNGIAVGASTYLPDFDNLDHPRGAGEIRIDYKGLAFRSEAIVVRSKKYVIIGIIPFGYIEKKVPFQQWGGYTSFLFNFFEKHQVGLRLEWFDPDNSIWRNSEFIATVGYNFYQTSRIKWQINFQDQVEQRGNRSNRHVYFSVANLQVSF